MIMTEKEFIEYINNSTTNIIYGDSEGRKRARDLIHYNIPSKYVIDTRYYYRNQYQEFEKSRTTFVSVEGIVHIGNIITNKTKAQSLLEISKFLKTKTRPIVIDSFTDVWKTIFHGSVDEEALKRRDKIDFDLVDNNVRRFYRNIASRKKRVVLFCDEKKDVIGQRIKMNIWWKVSLEVDGIIYFKDNQIILERDRLGYGIGKLVELGKRILENVDTKADIVIKELPKGVRGII